MGDGLFDDGGRTDRHVEADSRIFVIILQTRLKMIPPAVPKTFLMQL